MKRFLPPILALILFTGKWTAQDTLRVMAYNVLNYTSTDANKTRYLDLRTIINYFKPDLVICSEVIDGSGAQLLLDSAFNTAGVNYFARAVFNNGPDTDNMLFYNTQKASLKSQQQISTSLRDISHYRVYHINSPGDTSYLNLYSAHLKAGNTPSDSLDRLNEVTTFCNFISSMNANENIIIGGDFNFYSSNEAAFDYLTSSCSHILYDPINTPGDWNNNFTFANVHTQSTRSSSNPGCCGGATGGLDDRFDFLLGNARVINGGSKLKYIQGTYTSCGNDGNHYNKALIEAPSNSIVPSSVATALYNISDHLPVMMDLEVGTTAGITETFSSEELSMQMCLDAVGNSQLCIFSASSKAALLTFYDLAGRKISEKKMHTDKGLQMLSLNGGGLAPGTYITSLLTENDEMASCMVHIR